MNIYTLKYKHIHKPFAVRADHYKYADDFLSYYDSDGTLVALYTLKDLISVVITKSPSAR
jgi:hypothetical protein